MLQSNRTRGEMKQHFEIEGFSFLLEKVIQCWNKLETTGSGALPTPLPCPLSHPATSSTHRSLDLIQEGQGKKRTAQLLRNGLLGPD